MSNEQQIDPHDQATGDMRAGHSSYTEDEWRERLTAFLAVNDEHGSIVELERPEGGTSSASLVFSLQSGDEVRRYVARLEPEDSFFMSYDLAEQFEVQRHLHSVGLPVPEARWLDQSGEYLGRPGYVMEFIAGGSSTGSYFTTGPMSAATEPQRQRMIRTLVERLADFHQAADPDAVPALNTKGHGNGWVQRQMNFWFDLVEKGRPELLPLYEPVRDWLAAQAPDVAEPVLVHGDFQGSNVLWDDAGEKVVAVFDFEAVHIGARGSDLAWLHNMDELAAGFFGGYLDIELPTLQQRADWYEQACGVAIGDLDFYNMQARFHHACGGVGLARRVDGDLVTAPTPIMDYFNRRLLEVLPIEARLPLVQE